MFEKIKLTITPPIRSIKAADIATLPEVIFTYPEGRVVLAFNKGTFVLKRLDFADGSVEPIVVDYESGHLTDYSGVLIVHKVLRDLKKKYGCATIYAGYTTITLESSKAVEAFKTGLEVGCMVAAVYVVCGVILVGAAAAVSKLIPANE